MKYEFCKAHRKEHSLVKMLQVLGASRSGYYAWLKRGESNRSKSNNKLKIKIDKIFELHKGRYGSPRITVELHKEGENCSRVRVARLMKELGLRSKTRKKYKVTTNSNHGKKVNKNLLNQSFKISSPDRVWVSDITYVWTKTGWLYLTIIMDLFNREIIGSSKSVDLSSKNTVIKAFKEACMKRIPPVGLIFHSDRGIQYCSEEFRRYLKKYKIEQSMSGKGNCYDNAVSESFFHTLKREAVHGITFLNFEEASRELFEYIEVYYNRNRIHSTLGYMSPLEYLAHYENNLLKVS